MFTGIASEEPVPRPKPATFRVHAAVAEGVNGAESAVTVTVKPVVAPVVGLNVSSAPG